MSTAQIIHGHRCYSFLASISFLWTHSSSFLSFFLFWATGVGRASKVEGDGAGSRFHVGRPTQFGGSFALICTVLWIPHERRDCINLVHFLLSFLALFSFVFSCYLFRYGWWLVAGGTRTA